MKNYPRLGLFELRFGQLPTDHISCVLGPTVRTIMQMRFESAFWRVLWETAFLLVAFWDCVLKIVKYVLELAFCVPRSEETKVSIHIHLYIHI